MRRRNRVLELVFGLAFVLVGVLLMAPWEVVLVVIGGAFMVDAWVPD